MIYITQVVDELVRLGARLRSARLARDESMRVFAERIGICVPTLQAMERGAGTVALKHWANALWVLDRLPDLATVLAQTESPLDLARRPAAAQRQRARRRAA